MSWSVGQPAAASPTAAHLLMLCTGALGDEAGSVLEAPSEDDLRWQLVVLLGQILNNLLLQPSRRRLDLTCIASCSTMQTLDKPGHLR